MDYSTIAPGSRPSSISDSDPTVSCFDNIYQKRCEYEVPSNTTVLRFQCVDFINDTDDGLLWWQEIQRTATFVPKRYVYRFANSQSDLCSLDYPNFYITYENRLTQVRVDPSRGYLLSQTYQPDTAYICVKTPQKYLTTVYLRSAIVTLLRCATHYGTGITL